MPSSFKRFFVTYARILKLAYQIHPGLLILMTVSNAAWGLTNLPVLYINKALIDLVISSVGHPNTQVILKSVATLIIIRTLIEAFRSFLTRVNSNASYSFGSLMNDRISLLLGEKLNSLDVPIVESADFQDKYAKIESQANQRVWGMLSTLSEFPNAITTIISGVIPILQFNPLISLAVLIISFPDAIVSAKLAKLEYEERDKRRRLYRVLGRLNWLVTSVQQLYENKVLGNIRYVSQKMSSFQNDIFRNDSGMRTRRVKWRTLVEIPSWFLAAGLNFYFFLLAIIGKISLGTAQMLYQSSQTFSSGIGTLMNNVATVYEHYLFVSDYNWFMDLKSELQTGTLSFPVPFSGRIEFDHVWFKYDTSPDWILKDINFSINSRDNIALVGENGAGKTTLLKLLLGFYRPQQGEVRVGGKNVLDYVLNDYWTNLAVLNQDFHIYPFSGRESIAYYDLSRVNDLEAIRATAKKAKIDDFISSLPHGYDTPLAKDLDGVDPSGGQRQRIAIARALFKKSQIMILDEPTSNIDPKAEEEIFASIINETRDKILILVSHRFSTVRRADKILVLENGELVEQGTHPELVKQKGLYAKLFSLQAKSYQ